mgnify:FL=1
MSEVSCILVCVTAQKNCARLIDRGRALSARLHMPVRVLHVAAAAHSPGQPGGAEILNELFSLAHQADAEMEILYDPQPAEAIARYARQHRALWVVTGVDQSGFAERLRRLLTPDTQLTQAE